MGKAARRRALAPSRTAPARRSIWQILRPIVGIGSVAVLCAGIIAGALLAAGTKNSPSQDPPGVDSSAPSPAGALGADDPTPYGVVYQGKTAPAKDARTIEVVSDFQCPACAIAETSRVAALTSLADQGDIRLVWRPVALLDGPLDNSASKRATAAWGCALDAGRGEQYRRALYADQPTPPGKGWTDEELIALGADKAGLRVDSFAACVREGTYLGWAGNAAASLPPFDPAILPSIRYNGSDLPLASQASEQAIREFLDSQETTASASPEASPGAPSTATSQPSRSATESPAAGSPSASPSAQPGPTGR